MTEKRFRHEHGHDGHRLNLDRNDWKARITSSGELRSQATPAPDAMAEDAQIVVAAKALCVSRGLEPETLHQVFEDPYDHMDQQGRKFIFGWRKQMPHIEAIRSAIARHTGEK